MWSGRLTLTCAVVVVGAVAVACGDDGDSAPASPSPAPGGEETQASSPTPVLGDKETNIPERTGIAELDAIIDGFVISSTKPLWPLLRYTILPCTHTGGLIGPPGCRPDQEEGTPVEVMPVSTCELELLRPHEFERTLADLVERDLYGVYRTTSEVQFTGGYVIVLSSGPEMTIGTEVVIEDGRIVGVDFSCALTPEEVVELHGLEEALFVPDAP